MSRAIPDPGFAGDGGAADEGLSAALATWAGGGEAAPVHQALAATRLLVPVVAVALDVDGNDASEPVSEETERGTSEGNKRTTDAGTSEERERTASTDMALVTIRGGDGRTALPAFTSLATLTAWSPDARPVPVDAVKACLATIAEGADLLVLDAAGPVTFPVEGPALRALAQGRVPIAPIEDAEVAAAVREAADGEPDVVLAALLPAGTEPADAIVGLVLAPHAGPECASAAAHRIAARLAAHPVLRERLDRGLDLAVLSPGTGLDRPGAVVLFDRRSPERGLIG